MDFKWKIENFSRVNDFKLWKIKMQAILIQQHCVKALKRKTLMPTNLIQVEKIEMVIKTISVIILYPKDKVLRGVMRENTKSEMLFKFKSIYDQVIGSQIVSNTTSLFFSYGGE